MASAATTVQEPVKLNLTVREEYNDNVYQTADDRKSDTATTIAPTLNLFLGNDDHSLKFDYNASMLYYHKYTGQDFFQHTGSGELKLSLPARNTFKFFVTDTYGFFQRDIRQSDATLNKAEGNYLDLRPSILVEILDPMYLEAGYLYQRRDYNNFGRGTALEFKSFGPDFALGINLMPELDIALTYQHIRRDFDLTPDAITNGISDFKDNIAGVRLKTEFSPKLGGELSYSQLDRKYESGKDFKGDIWKSSLTFKPTDTTSLRAVYSEDFLEQVSGNLYELRRGEIMLTHSLGGGVELGYGGFGYRYSYLNIDRTDDGWGGQASISVPVMVRFVVLLQGRYEQRKFTTDTSKSRSNYYTANAETSYSIADWLRIFLSYTRTERDTEGDSASLLGTIAEYENNRYAVGLNMLY